MATSTRKQIMTPVRMKALMHHYYCREKLDDSKSYYDAVQYLLGHDLLEMVADEPQATPKGKFYVEHLINISFPVSVQTWEISND